ncbi:tryptophan synthase beta subunit-like PLP-dependent enzyme [Bimuria novae-zelandiae CBS 107.79]|uniref:L-serine ammonia-lyase n=1 Tax=Bimuria novae-zelandiae CBS 107.79 TaxID=1447943 RepID=A0A6A5UT23_9PLEO|nr:tryptophan synthase beta subunit-like PLP-dependent enzyme [Bimuria novae-zelandiae CBS 107.79]
MTAPEQQPKLPCPWRETPLILSSILSKHARCQIYLKLENLQPSGSFKSRGIGNFLLSHLQSADAEQRDKTHFYSSSGGNAGLACVHAAVTLGVPATIVVPMTTTQYTIDKMRAAGAADVLQEGASWYECDQYLRETVIPRAKDAGEIPVYVPPFDAEEIWDGHGTLVEEVIAQMPSGQKPDAILCSVGGGGLFCGIIRGLKKAGLDATPVLAVETEGAHSLALSLEKGELSTLPAITSIATTLGARTVAPQAFAYGQRPSVKSVVLTDKDAIEGCVRFADDERIMVEAACGVSLSLCYGNKLRQYLSDLTEKSRVVVVVCGGSNITAEMLAKWTRGPRQ